MESRLSIEVRGCIVRFIIPIQQHTVLRSILEYLVLIILVVCMFYWIYLSMYLGGVLDENAKISLAIERWIGWISPR